MIQPQEGDAPETTAEAALWHTLTSRLDREDVPDASVHLRKLVKARLDAVSEHGGLRAFRFSLHQRMSEYTVRFNARDGELMAWFFDALMLRSLPGLAEGPCLEAASAEAAPPDDAELDVATFEEQGDANVFIARWRHVVEGVPVERDYIQVLVNPRTGKPFALHRRWHTVDRRAIVR